MIISLICAWIAVLFAGLMALKYVTRKIGNKKLNKLFSKTHISCGILLLVFGAIHGIFGGNPSWSTLRDFQFAPVLFTFNLGTICFLLSIALAVTYYMRKQLKGKWMFLHRILTVAFIVCIVLHIYDTGIQLPTRLLSYTKELAGDKTDSVDKLENSQNTKIEEPLNSFSGAKLADGTYEGSAEGYNGTITVSVTVLEGKVTDISVLNQTDTPEFFERAQTIIDTILNKQTLDVDTVSGATFSSAGILNAVEDALKPAVVSGELDMNEVDLSNANRHGGRGEHGGRGGHGGRGEKDGSGGEGR